MQSTSDVMGKHMLCRSLTNKIYLVSVDVGKAVVIVSCCRSVSGGRAESSMRRHSILLRVMSVATVKKNVVFVMYVISLHRGDAHGSVGVDSI